MGLGALLIARKVSDARRRGAMSEAYRGIRRKPALAKAGGGAIEGNAAEPVPEKAGMMPSWRSDLEQKDLTMGNIYEVNFPHSITKGSEM